MMTHDIVVDGIRLHVVEAGTGPALVLLHGLIATHASWEHLIPSFAAHWRVVAPDLPGHGRSAKPDAPYTLDFYAGIVRSLGHALDLPEAIVIGNSFGGQVALELGATYPRWVRGLVLVAPASGLAGVSPILAGAIAAAASPALLRFVLPWALDLCFHDPTSAVAEARRRILAERLDAEDWPGFARAVGRSVAASITAVAPAPGPVPQPTLLVWGRDDRIVPVTGMRRVLAAVPHAGLEVLERCGHLPMLERPREFNLMVEEFLRVEAAPWYAPGAAGQG